MRVISSNGALFSALLGSIFSATPAHAGVDNPTPANFLRRPYCNAVVIGDYVYIDGGEMSQLENGKNNGEHPSYAGMFFILLSPITFLGGAVTPFQYC